MQTLQERFNANLNRVLRLSPNEYEGPLIIDRPCVLDGGGSTLWALSGPVLTIASPNVTVRNLRVDITGSTREGNKGIAIRTTHEDTVLENVEVGGRVTGLPGESEDWNLPRAVLLGEFAAEQENTFSWELWAPARAKVSCQMQGLRVNLKTVCPGTQYLRLTTDKLSDNTILYGEIFLKTKVMRRVYLWGRASKDAPVHCDEPMQSETRWQDGGAQVRMAETTIPPIMADAEIPALQRGERVSAAEWGDSPLQVLYSHRRAPLHLTVETCCFLLAEGDKVSSHADVIDRHNPVSVDGTVSLMKGRPLLTVDWERISPRVKKLAICYAVGGRREAQDFSQVVEPMLRLFGGDIEIGRFALTDLDGQNAVIGVELYRYRGQWRLKAVGTGYSDTQNKTGLQRLYERYGAVLTDESTIRRYDQS